jgi:HemY protein
LFRALWFFLQISFVVCAAVWLLSQKGAVDVVWNSYSFNINLGVFLLGLAIAMLLGMALLRVFGAIASMPSRYSRYKLERNRARGLRALTRGFVSVAAGDAKKATSFARDVRKLLPDERGLPLLLEAQAARLRGEEGAARRSFEELLLDEDAAFFGIKGLLKSSIEEGDTIKALSYAKTAQGQNPKQGWIVKSVYDLELQNRHWDAAYKTLERLKKLKAIDEAQAKKDETALLLILAEIDQTSGNESAGLKKIERAVKIDPSFVPAVVRLGQYHAGKGRRGKVASLIERAWKISPHPELADLWDKVAPTNKSSDLGRRLRWMEKLVALDTQNADVHVAAAKVAMDDGLWGEARAHLVTAEEIRPSAQIYRLRAKLEEETTFNANSINHWLQKATEAVPDSVWYCTLTGNIYEQWSPTPLPHRSFNTLEWGLPSRQSGAGQIAMQDWNDSLLIERS